MTSSSGYLGSAGAAVAIDTAQIIQTLDGVKAARMLPGGSIVGDLHGGLTFSDAIACALEARSTAGWHELKTPAGDVWTVIVLDR